MEFPDPEFQNLIKLQTINSPIYQEAFEGLDFFITWSLVNRTLLEDWYSPACRLGKEFGH